MPGDRADLGRRLKLWPYWICSAWPSGELMNAGSAVVVAVLRWAARGAGDRLRQRRAEVEPLEQHLEHRGGIVEPPGEPTARNGWPSRVMIVGLIELRGRLSPSARFGCVSESKLKSVSSLFSRKP